MSTRKSKSWKPFQVATAIDARFMKRLAKRLKGEAKTRPFVLGDYGLAHYDRERFESR